ncbi:hypothetical protein ColTof4_03464 [Colletotrichum tofieldiae]|nr:hypothetical protein ColTof3_13112 [Colletotrichum tofieldiae]GKT71041.1 hypothetical protein ColTof4_03464 [Colletotrichum tofieldiae]GKT94042.1 hypothetical protein Ct61P_11892 [Colletotrichum tofieldiae]
MAGDFAANGEKLCHNINVIVKVRRILPEKEDNATDIFINSYPSWDPYGFIRQVFMASRESAITAEC